MSPRTTIESKKCLKPKTRIRKSNTSLPLTIYACVFCNAVYLLHILLTLIDKTSKIMQWGRHTWKCQVKLVLIHGTICRQRLITKQLKNSNRALKAHTFTFTEFTLWNSGNLVHHLSQGSQTRGPRQHHITNSYLELWFKALFSLYCGPWRHIFLLMWPLSFFFLP